MPGTLFLIAVSITVEPSSPSTVRVVPSESMKVMLAMIWFGAIGVGVAGVIGASL